MDDVRCIIPVARGVHCFGEDITKVASNGSLCYTNASCFNVSLVGFAASAIIDSPRKGEVPENI